ncbi:hypothetical protein UPYG_G00024250 [Umbra pygmaea]|uniref:Transmembrane protein 182 n=1 Tax=Umbra pygmaea TaxID=75934 RepID=A0ABD0YAI5_UMBPY
MSPAERGSVLLFLAGFFGGLGALFLMLCFGMDYWLLASETCGPGGSLGAYSRGETEDQDNVSFFHQGFFWRCSFLGRREEDTVWAFWIPHQPNPKVCVPAYLFSLPASEPTMEQMSPDSAVYKAFWSLFLVVGWFTVMIGGFLVICASPFAKGGVYKAGGVLLLTGSLCLLVVIGMYVVWTQVLDSMENYATHQHLSSSCPAVYQLNVHNGPSFMLAPVSIFFLLLAALLFLMIGRTAQSQRRGQAEEV